MISFINIFFDKGILMKRKIEYNIFRYTNFFTDVKID